MEIGENNATKKVPVLVLKTYEKAGAQKWASPVLPRSGTPEIHALCLPKRDPGGGHHVHPHDGGS